MPRGSQGRQLPPRPGFWPLGFLSLSASSAASVIAREESDPLEGREVCIVLVVRRVVGKGTSLNDFSVHPGRPRCARKGRLSPAVLAAALIQPTLLEPQVRFIFETLCCWCSVAKLSDFFCDPMDHSPPGFSVHGISQARILEGLPVFPPGNLPYPGLELMSPALAADSFPLSPQGSPSECLMEI